MCSNRYYDTYEPDPIQILGAIIIYNAMGDNDGVVDANVIGGTPSV